jgi:hypothetical protein
MGEIPNYLLSLVDNEEEWQQDEHINGTGKESERKNERRLMYEMDKCSAE